RQHWSQQNLENAPALPIIGLSELYIQAIVNDTFPDLPPLLNLNTTFSSNSTPRVQQRSNGHTQKHARFHLDTSPAVLNPLLKRGEAEPCDVGSPCADKSRTLVGGNIVDFPSVLPEIQRPDDDDNDDDAPPFAPPPPPSPSSATVPSTLRPHTPSRSLETRSYEIVEVSPPIYKRRPMGQTTSGLSSRPSGSSSSRPSRPSTNIPLARSSPSPSSPTPSSRSPISGRTRSAPMPAPSTPSKGKRSALVEVEGSPSKERGQPEKKKRRLVAKKDMEEEKENF
ncbi:MAG: hypothetical protein Q9192_005953, partial [Flavoplaca navasiana]